MGEKNKINWRKAPAVPVDIHLKNAAGEVIDGKIIVGPLGQTTYVPNGGSAPTPRDMSAVETGVVHSDMGPGDWDR